MTEKAKLTMEAKLEEDKVGKYKREVLGEFGQQAAEIKRTLNQGVAPSEYKQVSLLLKSIEAAEDTVEKVWRYMHGAH